MKGNISQYRIFSAVAEAGSISGAAKKLFISQPAVSKSISSLEESLGTELFSRGARGVKLTEEGVILYRHVSEAFKYLESGEGELRRFKELGIGHISLGASTTLCRYKLLPYLRSFSQSHPHISLGISCQPTIQTLQLIGEGIVDIGLIARQDNMPGIDFLKIGEIRDIFTATPDYLKNLAIRCGEKWIEDFAENIGNTLSGEQGLQILDLSTLMLLDKGNATRQFVENYLEEKHVHPENMIEVTTMDLLIEFARTGLGIACVIEDFVKNDLEDHTLLRIPVSPYLKTRDIGFAWAHGKPESNAISAFQSFVAELTKEK